MDYSASKLQLSGRSLLLPFWLIFPLLCMGQAFDTTPPKLIGFSFAPTSVNVTSGPETVTVTLHVTDNLSGFFSGKAYVNVGFTSPSGNQNQYADTNVTVLPGSMPLNATYQESITIPQFSESGNWTASVNMSDADGNLLNLSASDLASMFFPSVLPVTSVSDTTPPTLTGLSISPSSINVSNGPQSVTLSLNLTDSQSGVAFPCQQSCGAMLYFIGPSGDQLLSEWPYNAHLTSGNINAGVWKIAVTFPQHAAAGAWTLFDLAISDTVGNFAFLGTQQLQNLGFPTTVQISSTPTDNVPPVLTGVSISPSVINTSAGPQTITLGLGLTDNLSGVDFTAGSLALTPDSNFNTSFFTINFEALQGAIGNPYFEVFGSNSLPLASPNFNVSVIVFTSPSGQQNLIVNPYRYSFLLNSGTPLNGQWEVTATLPQYSEGGTWTLQYLTVQDSALNTLFLSQAALQASKFPNSFVVYEPSLTPDGSIGSTGGTVTDTVFGSRASVSLPAGAVNGPISVAIDVLNSSNSPLVPTPTGFATTPATFFTNIVLTPEPNFPLQAPGGTLVLPLTSPMTPGTVLSLFSINGQGNSVPDPSTNPPPINVQGTVDASGLSATFTNLSHFSTFVGYLPNPGTVFGDVNEDGIVNCKDIAIIKADFGKKKGQTGYNPLADLNNDGVINILDLAIDARLLPKGMTCP